VRITLHACDSALAEGGPWIFEPWEELRLPRRFEGGGGTSFVPVFEWLERAGQRPDALIYFTDADGEFPARAPDYPVLWLVKGRAPVPFGRRIQLN
ncbi:MAG: VWA-like domain-containing protein, partial [Rhodocyclaceae bacterium]